MTQCMSWGNATLAALVLATSAMAAKPSDCERALIKKALRVIRATEENRFEAHNLGWTAEDIANLGYAYERDFLKLVKPTRRGHNLSYELHTLLDLRNKIAEWEKLLKNQRQSGTFNMTDVEEAAAKIFADLEIFLNQNHIQYFTKSSQRGYPVLIISTEGKHALNRLARALFHEYSLHMSIEGQNSGIVIDFDIFRIPPSMFASPTWQATILRRGARLLAAVDRLPVAYVDPSSKAPAQMQDAYGKWHLLDWRALDGQVVRVNSRKEPPQEETEDINKESEFMDSSMIVQKVQGLRGYIESLPPHLRERAFGFFKKFSQDALTGEVVFGAFEMDDEWFTIWPLSFSKPTLSTFHDYLAFFIKNDNFKKKTAFEEVLKFHMFVMTPEVEPIENYDKSMFEALKNQITNQLPRGRGQKRPRVEVTFHKLSLLNRRGVVFEPITIEIEAE